MSACAGCAGRHGSILFIDPSSPPPLFTDLASYIKPEIFTEILKRIIQNFLYFSSLVVNMRERERERERERGSFSYISKEVNGIEL